MNKKIRTMGLVLMGLAVLMTGCKSGQMGKETTSAAAEADQEKKTDFLGDALLDAELSSAAFGFCSILFDISSLWYGIISFLEEEKNHMIARITVILSGLMLAGWIITIIMGIRG